MRRNMAVFVRIDVEPAVAADPGLAKQLEEVCPVDIFKAGCGSLEILGENVDECTRYELCRDVGRPVHRRMGCTGPTSLSPGNSGTPGYGIPHKDGGAWLVCTMGLCDGHGICVIASPFVV